MKYTIINQPLLQIIIPTYRRRKELSRLLDSLFEQGYSDFSGALQILISENGGSNEADLVVDKYKRKLPITYIKQPAPLGALLHIAYLYAMANGEYLWIIGDDDVVIDLQWCFLKKKINCGGNDIIMLGHLFKTNNGEVKYDPGYDRLNQEKKSCDALELVASHPSVFTFISIVIMRTDKVHGCLSKVDFGNGYMPLELLFLVSSKSRCEYISGDRIQGSWGDNSWSHQASYFVNKCLPMMFDRLSAHIPHYYIDKAIESIFRDGYILVSDMVKYDYYFSIGFFKKHGYKVDIGLRMASRKSISNEIYIYKKSKFISNINGVYAHFIIVYWSCYWFFVAVKKAIENKINAKK